MNIKLEDAKKFVKKNATEILFGVTFVSCYTAIALAGHAKTQKAEINYYRNASVNLASFIGNKGLEEEAIAWFKEHLK